MNTKNMVHAFAPFTALLIALYLLGKESAELHYYPALFAFFSILIICCAFFAPLKVQETKKNFVIFFAVYPFWVFAAVIPAFTSLFNGALGSLGIFLIGTLVQWVILTDFTEKKKRA